ncbi:hypothetical protein PCASD_05306 [Puccinia coronata f. sp. avenae]|uniref:DNA 3'-5' helicase n=2 Tax=Puccinia coronata f. sp. avenae TaxID=200324 RepID=A0A2N5UXT8_9BASI|nr:hypothetical protein PCASD_05306 [Puccinia coronata f. sp. avenae]
MLPSSIRQLPISQRIRTPSGVNIFKKIMNKSNDDMKAHISRTAKLFYQQPAKSLQVDAVLNLVNGRNTFLLAGTGFGKSRIPEIYSMMLPRRNKAIVLTLNPLDTLGDNQVEEKIEAGFTAINLNKMNFNQTTADEIANGNYQFIYLSPEIFLNNKIWEDVYFSSAFQNRLSLVVIDEAHMIYIWGLVKSGPGKHLAKMYGRQQDVGIFRPSYGNLGGQLQSRNNIPILLLSATCRPIAVKAIKESLRLDDSEIDILRGELTRPEIRIIRVQMDYSLSSCLDLIKVFPSINDVRNEDLIPALVYSGSRIKTLTAMEVISRAREIPGDAFNPHSTCARRYHSCTGDRDKVDCVAGFSNGDFPIFSCTMALGLGQNWKRVRMVTHLGRGDPASIIQMVGRAGRDGRPGLAVLFVEKNRRNGKNSLDAFVTGAPQIDDDQMDALAITPVCLRIAFSLDNLLGYIPLSLDDPNYIKEAAREREAGFTPCTCSNCAAPQAIKLIKNLAYANKDNFDLIISDQFAPGLQQASYLSKLPPKKARMRKRKIPESEQHVLDEFKDNLIKEFESFYTSLVGSEVSLHAENLFGMEEANALASYLHLINTTDDVRVVIGGECVPGQLQWILKKTKEYNFPVNSTTDTNETRPDTNKLHERIEKKARSNRLTTTQQLPSTLKRTKNTEDAKARRVASLERAAEKKKRREADEQRQKQIKEIMATVLNEKER